MASTARYRPHREFPPYTYVPGLTPHPIRDPAGHMFGETAHPAHLAVEEWWTCDEYLWGIDLFNHGYYWEAHEAWEGLWHAAGRTGPVADFLKGLIKLAAAGVKTCEGSAAGRQRHLRRARELLTAARQTLGSRALGIDLDPLLEAISGAAVEGSLRRHICPEAVFTFALAPEDKR